jgi:hypothetical protein
MTDSLRGSCKGRKTLHSAEEVKSMLRNHINLDHKEHSNPDPMSTSSREKTPWHR